MRKLHEAEIADVLSVMYDFGGFGRPADFAQFLDDEREAVTGNRYITSYNQVWRWKEGKSVPKDDNVSLDVVVSCMQTLYKKHLASDVALEFLLDKLEERTFDVAEYRGRAQDPSKSEDAAADGANDRIFARVVAQLTNAAFEKRSGYKGGVKHPAAEEIRPEKRQTAAAKPSGITLNALKAVLEDAGMIWPEEDGFLSRLLPPTLLHAVPELETDSSVMAGTHGMTLRQKVFEKLAHDSRLTVRELVKRMAALLQDLDRDRYLSGAERLLETLGTETAGLLRLKRCWQICGSRHEGSGPAVLIVFALLGETHFVRLIKSDRDFDFFGV